MSKAHQSHSQGIRSQKKDWERYVAHKKATASALKAARWDHLNGILQTSLEEKKTLNLFTGTSRLKKR